MVYDSNDLVRIRQLTSRGFPSRSKSGPHHFKQRVFSSIIFMSVNKFTKRFLQICHLSIPTLILLVIVCNIFLILPYTKEKCNI